MATIAIETGTLNGVSNAILQINRSPTTEFLTNNPTFVEVEDPLLGDYYLLYSYDGNTFTYEADLSAYYLAENEADENYIQTINDNYGAVATGTATTEQETDFNTAITTLSGTYPPSGWGSGGSGGSGTLVKEILSPLESSVDANFRYYDNNTEIFTEDYDFAIIEVIDQSDFQTFKTTATYTYRETFIIQKNEIDLAYNQLAYSGNMIGSAYAIRLDKDTPTILLTINNVDVAIYSIRLYSLGTTPITALTLSQTYNQPTYTENGTQAIYTTSIDDVFNTEWDVAMFEILYSTTTQYTITLTREQFLASTFTYTLDSAVTSTVQFDYTNSQIIVINDSYASIYQIKLYNYS